VADTLKEFLISFGFSVDDSSRARAEAGTRAAEERITATNIAQAARRLENDRKANAAKLAQAVLTGAQLTDAEKKIVTEQEKLRVEADERDRKVTADQDKRRRERLEETTKQLRTFALRATAVAAGVFTAVEGAAGGIFYAADRAAKGFERLNYVSRDTGASVRGIGAFSYAIEQLGGNAQAAEASLANFGKRIHTLPGVEQAIRKMGIATREANGEFRKTEDIARDFLHHNAGRSRVEREMLGQAYGIDDSTVQAGSQPGFEGRYSEALHDQAATGNDANANAAKGTAFAQAVRRLRTIGGGLEDNVTGTLFDKLQPQVEKFSAWLDANGERIAAIVGRIADDIIKLATAITNRLSKVDWDGVITSVENFVKEFDAIATKAFGENGTLALPFIAFGAMITASVLGPLRAVMSTLGLLSKVPGIGVLGAIAAGATAESTPGAGVPADASERAKVAEQNQRDTDAANAKLGQGKGFFADLWTYAKKQMGFEASAAEVKDRRVNDAIIGTEKSVTELKNIVKDKGLDGQGGSVMGGVTASSGGVGGSGQHFGGSSSPGAQTGDAARRHGGRGGGGSSAADPNLPVGNVPGATGYGAINAYWKGALDKRGEGGHTGPKEMFDYLKSQGASDNEALLLTGAASSESSFNPNAVHDHGSGHGLFGHNDGRLDMRGKNWQQQSVLALAEARRMMGGKINSARTSEELADLEMHYERPRGYTRNNPRAGDNYMGRLNSIRRFSALTGHPTATVPVPAGTSAQAVTDAEVFAARQRLQSGGRDPKDRALVDRYKTEQNSAGGTNAPVKVEVTKPVPLTPASQAIHQHLLNERTVLAAHHGMLHPFLHGKALGDTEALRRSVHHSLTKGDTNVNHSQTFNIQGGDPKQNMEAARMVGNRGSADLLRNVVGMEA
jgi:hypothetical protein